ncbi:hypothetical protein [Bacillus subtilis]|nr:hypothetical protein [Bacillus subtilis]
MESGMWSMGGVREVRKEFILMIVDGVGVGDGWGIECGGIRVILLMEKGI